MAVVGPDDRTIYHEINVDVSSLQAWSDELRRLVGLTTAADSAVGHWSVNNFVGYGPDGAEALRGLNAEALATLAAAVEQLDDLTARLRDAAAYVAGSYVDSDGYARAGVDAVRAGWRGETPAGVTLEAGVTAAGSGQVLGEGAPGRAAVGVAGDG